VSADRPTHTAPEVAARLWPPPDPVNFAKREAIRYLALLDRALRNVVDLRSGADELIFPELTRLWIHPSRMEILLGLLRAELQAADRLVGNVLDLLLAARGENFRREGDERLLERREKQAEPQCG
jgi:hypothetical protein